MTVRKAEDWFDFVLVVVGVLLLGWSLLPAAFAQQPSRESSIIEALQSQRNQANDAVAVCYADSRKEVAELKAKIAELEKPKEPAASSAKK